MVYSQTVVAITSHSLQHYFQSLSLFQRGEKKFDSEVATKERISFSLVKKYGSLYSLLGLQNQKQTTLRHVNIKRFSLFGCSS